MLAEDVSTKEGAEAKYRLIEIYYIQNKYDDAEAEINDFRKASTPYQEWLAHSFIIWADIFKSRGDYHMAKSVLQIIIDKYKGKDKGIVDKATDKYVEIVDMEEAEEELNEAVEVDVIEKIDEVDKLIDNEEDINIEPLKEENSEPKTETEN